YNVKKNFLYKKDITREDHLNWLKNKVDKGKVIQFIIIEKKTGIPIGSVYFRDMDPVLKQAEYGIFIGEDNARNKGYGSESAREMVRYFFDELKYKKLILRVLRSNLAAIRSYEKAGFTKADREETTDSNNGDQVIFMEINSHETD
nr:GNAT family N-acetyltransferase [Lachnospiraceae bacterium]